MTKPTVICLTPVKNEAWILHRFLKCASLWTDHIIIADQSSDDGSREIALSYPKVTLVDNPSPTFNEPERQKILLEAARRIPGPRLIIALDADEMLTANFLDSPEWDTVLQADPGTVIRLQFAVIRPDLCSYWLEPHTHPYGFVDDGSEHVGRKIHSQRVPVPSQAPSITLRDIKVMHYVGVDSEKWASKHRWYQCWERLNRPQRRSIDIYRHYHRIDDIPPHEIKPMPEEWMAGYRQRGIDMTSVSREGVFRWDMEVLAFLGEYGPAKFKRQAIWDVDWTALHREIYPDAPPVRFKDPRNWLDKWVHRWLRKTQPYYSHFSPYYEKTQSAFSRLSIRVVRKMLGFLGW
jgi:glycosyltransferase involved in cell wall biosynthesis